MNNTVLKHIIFWVTYLLLWSVRDLVYHDDYLDLLQSNTISTICYAFGVYINLYWLMPRLLLKKKYWLYGVVLIITVLFFAYLTALTLYYYFNVIHQPALKDTFFTSLEGFIFLITEQFMLIAVTSVFYLLDGWYKNEQRLKSLENKNLSTELNVLKSQVNPHFLFNALNSVYVLINSDQNKARETLANISELLSHQLYDGSKERVPLNKELKHIKNYIDLEQVRQGEKVKICWKVEGASQNHSIAPMLLIPFVENAFKHGLKSNSSSNKIDIYVSIINGNITFNCSNAINTESRVSEHGGVGLSNVQRRLDLIYPNTHQLEITKNGKIYNVQLKIKLNGN